MYNSLRIGGLASGMDIDQMVRDMMKVERMRVDKLEQKKQALEWRQDDYQEINSSLRALRDAVFQMKLQGSFLTKKAVSSNTAAVEAAAGAGAVAGSYDVTVTQLATGVTKGSQGTLADEVDTDGSTKTLAEQFGLTGTITFTLEGSGGTHEFSFDTGTANIYTVAAAINEADLGINAGYDAALDRFSLTTTSTGEAAIIKVTNDVNHFLSGDQDAGVDGMGDPGIENGDNTLGLLLKGDGTSYEGHNASFDFGDMTGLTSATNTVTVNGLTLTLKEAGSTTVTVSRDTDAVYDKIAAFVEKYNEVMGKVYDELYEERYSDYQPLTDDQREELTDKQIEQWEEKAKSGLLRSDATLFSLGGRLRQGVSAPVGGASAKGYNSLAAIGIKTTADYFSPRLEIDEEDLRQALEEEPDGVMNLFTQSSEVDGELGIAQRLYAALDIGIDQIIDKAGGGEFSLVDNSVIGKQVSDLNDQIVAWEERLLQIEDRYWRQFSAMEEAIQQMNAQSMWLAQQFGQTG